MKFNTVEINKLRVRGRSGIDPALRLVLSSGLANVSFQPAGMPPHAILLIKHLHDPLPGKLCHRNHPYVPNRDWQQAITEQLNGIYRNALRPGNGVLPLQADAIVFSDKAELLASLSLDVVTGRAWQCWWWKKFLTAHIQQTDVALPVVQLLVEHIEYLPAVMSLLTAWQQAAPLLNILGRGHALDLSMALAHTNQLSDMVELMHRLSDDSLYPKSQANSKNGNAWRTRASGASSDIESDNAQSRNQRNANGHGVQHKVSRLRELFARYQVTAIPADTELEHILLLGLSALLYQKPWLLRHAEFKQRLEHVLLDTVMPEQSADEPVATDKNRIDNKTVEAVAKKALLRRNPQILPEDDEGAVFSDMQIKLSDDDGFAEADHAAADNAQTCEVAEVGDDDSLPIAFNESGITTELGGIFYLFNLLQWMDLPECFENHWQLSRWPGSWAVLEAMARVLLGEAVTEFHDDAIWSLLRELDGRDADTPIFMEDSTDYRLPPIWFYGVDDPRETCRWHGDSTRLQLWTASGFLLVDIARNDQDAFDQALTELHNYTADEHAPLLATCEHEYSSSDPSDSSGTCSPGFEKWLHRVMPYVRYRIGLAIGSPDAEAFRQLLQCRGLVYVTSSHIDFVAPLNNISLAARRSGLDRDPGWLAEIGRVVLFHFA